jgi:hypothetical protein
VSNNGSRPMYFDYSALNGLALDFEPYLVNEGPVMELTPFRNTQKNIAVNNEKAYKNLILDADYSNLKDPDVYFNYEDYHLRVITPVRQSFNALALSFLTAGKGEMTKKVLLFAIDHLYGQHLVPSYTNLQASELLAAVNEPDKAVYLSKSLFDHYYAIVRGKQQLGSEAEELEIILLQNAAEMLAQLGESQYAALIEQLHLPE